MIDPFMYALMVETNNHKCVEIPTKISSFYKARELKSYLEMVDEYKVAEQVGNSEYTPDIVKGIKAKLIAGSSEVNKLISKYKNEYLQSTKTYMIPKSQKELNEIKKLFKVDGTIKLESTLPRETIDKYVPRNKGRVSAAIESFQEEHIYSLNMPTAGGLHVKFMQDIVDLLAKCKIESKDSPKKIIADRDNKMPVLVLTQEFIVVEGIITNALALMKIQSDSSKAGGEETPNIINSSEHLIFSAPILYGSTQAITATVAGHDLTTISEKYIKTSKGGDRLRIKEGKYLIEIEAPEKVYGFMIDTPREQWPSLVAQYEAQDRIYLATFIEYKKQHPEKEAVTHLKDVLKCCPYFAESIKKGRSEIYADAVESYIRISQKGYKMKVTETSKDAKGKKVTVTSWKTIYPLERLGRIQTYERKNKSSRIIEAKENNEYADARIIENLNFTDDFIACRGFNQGAMMDGILEVAWSNTYVNMLSYLRELQVRNQTDTTKSEPIVVGVDELADSTALSGTNKTNRDRQIEKFANYITGVSDTNRTPVQLFSKWETARGDQKITRSDPKTLTLRFYPLPKTQLDYRTTAQYENSKSISRLSIETKSKLFKELYTSTVNKKQMFRSPVQLTERINKQLEEEEIDARLSSEEVTLMINGKTEPQDFVMDIVEDILQEFKEMRKATK